MHFEDARIGTVQGLFTLLGADEGIELGQRAQRAGAVGAVPDQVATWRSPSGSAVRPQASDYLVVEEPTVDGRWQVMGARWTPGDGVRLILKRS